jgi:hypothetical protein
MWPRRNESVAGGERLFVAANAEKRSKQQGGNFCDPTARTQSDRPVPFRPCNLIPFHYLFGIFYAQLHDVTGNS